MSFNCQWENGLVIFTVKFSAMLYQMESRLYLSGQNSKASTRIPAGAPVPQASTRIPAGAPFVPPSSSPSCKRIEFSVIRLKLKPLIRNFDNDSQMVTLAIVLGYYLHSSLFIYMNHHGSEGADQAGIVAILYLYTWPATYELVP